MKKREYYPIVAQIRLGNKIFYASESLRLAAWVMLVSGLYVIRDVVGIAFPEIIFSGVCGLAFFMLGQGASLGLFIFTTPLTVPHNEIMLLYVSIMLMKQYKDTRLALNSRLFSITVIILVLQMVDMILFYKGSPATIIYQYITRMMYILIPVLWYSLDISATEYRDSIICYIVGALLGAVIVIAITGQNIGWGNLMRGEGFWRIGKTLDDSTSGMQTNYNANQLGGMMSISVGLLIGLIERKQINRFLGIMSIGFAFVVIILTKSRSSLLCIGVIGVLYLCHMWRLPKQRLKGTIYFGIVVIAMAGIIQIFPDLFSGVMERFSDQEDITNGRAELLVIYLQEWSSNPWSLLFGYGVASYAYVIDAHNVAHNAITDILICWGLTGFILIALTLSMFYQKVISSIPKCERLLLLLPVLAAGVSAMAGQYLTIGYPHMRLCFLILAMSIIRKQHSIE